MWLITVIFTAKNFSKCAWFKETATELDFKPRSFWLENLHCSHCIILSKMVNGDNLLPSLLFNVAAYD